MNKEILFFDAESNGFPNWKERSDDPNQPHIVQLAAAVADVESRTVKQCINLIIKPDNWLIGQETIEIHGITNEYAMEVGVSELDAVNIFLNLLGDNERVSHNTTFDNRMIRIALKRFFSDQFADNFKTSPYYCTLQNSKKIMGGKSGHTLSEVYKHFTGKELEGAHNAMVDTLACMEVYWAIQDLETQAT